MYHINIYDILGEKRLFDLLILIELLTII
jgi:hypothetical protein